MSTLLQPALCSQFHFFTWEAFGPQQEQHVATVMASRILGSRHGIHKHQGFHPDLFFTRPEICACVVEAYPGLGHIQAYRQCSHVRLIDGMGWDAGPHWSSAGSSEEESSLNVQVGRTL